MDGSSMRIFLRGEVFELRQKEIGVLLEGFVRQDNSTEMITAPAGLILKTPLPSPAGQCTFLLFLSTINASFRTIVSRCSFVMVIFVKMANFQSAKNVTLSAQSSENQDFQLFRALKTGTFKCSDGIEFIPRFDQLGG